MNPGDIVGLAGDFGPLGLMVAYLIWDKSRSDKWLQQHAKERLEADQVESITREKLASSLTALTMVIQGRPNV